MNGFIKLVLFVRYIQNLNMTWMQIIMLILVLILLLMEVLMIFINLLVDKKRAVRYLPIVVMTLLIGAVDIYARPIVEVIVNNV